MGAAGNVGGKVAEMLLEAGEEVRVLRHARDLGDLERRGATVMSGDAMNAGDLRAFFDGTVAALVLLPEDLADPMFVEHRRMMSRAIRDALADAGVAHVVALSTVSAAREDAAGPPGGLYAFERDLAELQANVLVLRSAAYMENLLAALPLIRAQSLNGSAVGPDARFPTVATIDVAREAADRLRRRDFSGHQVEMLLGPREITMAEATAAMGARLGVPDLPYVEFPPDGVRGALIGAGMSEEVAGLIVDLQLAVNEGNHMDGVRPTSGPTTPTGLEDFLAAALPETMPEATR
jgi:uncharacterized protein YbjT (DUF2867 family)